VEETLVALESGTSAKWVTRLLVGCGWRVRVLEAAEVRAKARRRGQKSDYRDAWEICDGVRRDLFVKSVYVAPPQVERVRQVLSRRRHFVSLRTSQINAARFVLRVNGVAVRAASLTTWRAWQRLLSRPEVAAVERHLRHHAEMWKHAQEVVTALDAELREAMEPMAGVWELLQSVPGVGPVASAAFVATLGCCERFGDGGQAASYAGLVPRSFDSGDSVRRGRITKAGSPLLRSLLCEVAHHAGRPWHPLHPYWIRVCARGGYKKATVAVAHRLCRILLAMWKRGRAFDPGLLNVELVGGGQGRGLRYRIRRPAA
jgi:transposase